MARGVRTPEHIQRRIEYLYIEQGLKGPTIEESLRKDGIRLDNGREVPVRTISDHIKKILKQYPMEEQRLDSPW